MEIQAASDCQVSVDSPVKMVQKRVLVLDTAMPAPSPRSCPETVWLCHESRTFAVST